MSVEFMVLSPLSPAELGRVESSCQSLVERWYEEHGDSGEEWGPFELGGWIPAEREARDMVWVNERQAPDDHPKIDQVLRRLKTIRSVITIERPGNLEIDAIQVSILKYLVEHAGAGLVSFVDALEPCEEVLRELASKPQIEGFADS